MDLSGRTALVTGASRGLGRALAEELAKAGMRVAMVARGEDELVRAAGEIPGAVAIPGDVADKMQVHAIAGAAAAAVGPIDLLVNNASALGPVPLVPLLDTDCEELERVLAANLVGPFRLTKIVAGAMVVRGGGAIVDVTSDASVAAYPTWGAYGVSKAALDHLGRIWAAELDGTGVRFLTVDPGEMNTKMHADAIPGADRAALRKPADVAARIVELLRRIESIPSGTRMEASS